MAHSYILYSKQVDKYYVGATQDDIIQRIRRHNTNHTGFTGKANDWVLVCLERFESMELALRREREIKSWKSRKLIKKLCSRQP